MIEKLLLRALEKKCKGCNSIEIELNLLQHEIKLSFEKTNGQIDILNNHIDNAMSSIVSSLIKKHIGESNINLIDLKYINGSSELNGFAYCEINGEKIKKQVLINL